MHERVKLSELKPWDKNPREIEPEDLERLKEQIKKLGVYKPLIVNKDNVIVGGNMRYQAMKELGVKEVWVSVVDAQDEKTMLEYALSDNDQVGQYDATKLSRLLGEVSDIDLDFKVNLASPISLDEFMIDLSPEELSDDFSLPDGDKPDFEQITFTLHKRQAAEIKQALALVIKTNTVKVETFGNENKNGNAIYAIVHDWLEQSKL